MHSRSPATFETRIRGFEDPGTGHCPPPNGTVSFLANIQTPGVQQWVYQNIGSVINKQMNFYTGGHYASNQALYLDDMGASQWHETPDLEWPTIDAQVRAEASYTDALCPRPGPAGTCWHAMTNSLGGGSCCYPSGPDAREDGVYGYAVDTDLFTRYSTKNNIDLAEYENPFGNGADFAATPSYQNLRIVINTNSQLLANSHTNVALHVYGLTPDGRTTQDRVRRLSLAAAWLTAEGCRADGSHCWDYSRIYSWDGAQGWNLRQRWVGVLPERTIWVRNALPNAITGDKTLTPWVWSRRNTPFGNGTGCTTARPYAGPFVLDKTGDEGGTTSLAVSCGSEPFTGVAAIYAREFRDCYVRGVRLGRCGVVANATNGSVTIARTWLHFAHYTNTIAWTGGTLRDVCPGLTSVCNGRLVLTGPFSADVTKVPGGTPPSSSATIDVIAPALARRRPLRRPSPFARRRGAAIQ